MKGFFAFVALVCLVISSGDLTRIDAKSVPPQAVLPSQPTASSTGDAAAPAQMTPVYPIAPGLWYPGDGALREKPMRYYRVRCWPGCHRGSAHGMYPEEPLDMTPIYPTSTVPGHDTPQAEVK
jgi:hypothetical protein